MHGVHYFQPRIKYWKDTIMHPQSGGNSTTVCFPHLSSEFFHFDQNILSSGASNVFFRDQYLLGDTLHSSLRENHFFSRIYSLTYYVKVKHWTLWQFKVSGSTNHCVDVVSLCWSTVNWSFEFDIDLTGFSKWIKLYFNSCTQDLDHIFRSGDLLWWTSLKIMTLLQRLNMTRTFFQFAIRGNRHQERLLWNCCETETAVEVRRSESSVPSQCVFHKVFRDHDRSHRVDGEHVAVKASLWACGYSGVSTQIHNT